MSRVKDLTNEIYPDGVEFRPMWSLTAWDKKFNAVDRTKQPSVRKYHYFLANELNELLVDGGDVKVLTTSETDLWTTEALVGGAVSDAEIVAIPWGGNAVVQYHRGKFVTADNRIAVVNDPQVLSTKFLYYYLQDNLETIASFYRGSGIKHPSMAKVLDMPVPLPPLDVQLEVVRILDQFTHLEAELEAELKARQYQYAYYRDSLMRLDGVGCEWLTLKEVALDFGRGKSKHRPRNDPKLYGGRYPFIQTGDIRNAGHLITEYSQTYSEEGLAQSKLWPAGTLCITIAANIAETGVLTFDACFPDSVIGMVVNPNRASQYFVEFLLQSLKVDLAAKGQGSAQANINLGTFENERFPFPPLKEQERIVSILDKFDALISNSSSGIPAELRARRMQYEHYRNRLLSFREVPA